MDGDLIRGSNYIPEKDKREWTPFDDFELVFQVTECLSTPALSEATLSQIFCFLESVVLM